MIARAILSSQPRRAGIYWCELRNPVVDCFRSSLVTKRVPSTIECRNGAWDRFESAEIAGTIFLDEVGDLPPEIQIALLRVLQEREIERVGSNRPIPIDVRVLAATHRDLNALVAEGKFRQDLLYRLNVVPIEMPSLRDRAPDIPLLVEYFIDRVGKKGRKEVQNNRQKNSQTVASLRLAR